MTKQEKRLEFITDLVEDRLGFTVWLSVVYKNSVELTFSGLDEDQRDQVVVEVNKSGEYFGKFLDNNTFIVRF